MPVSEFMPKQKETVSVNVRVSKELRDEVADILESNGWTWVQFVEASMESILKEQKGKKK
jgi:antitoxin component of RelBE/YafQ-DinJ toxin-antitoxin module